MVSSNLKSRIMSKQRNLLLSLASA